MELQNSFDVAAPADKSWRFLLDPQKVVPCMPGAELAEVVEPNTWDVKARVKLGPVTLNYKGRVTIEERDDAAMRVVLKGAGTETRGKGSVSATIESVVTEVGGATHADIKTDLKISGKAASFGRGMIADVASKLTKQFADNMEAQLAYLSRAEVAAAESAGEGDVAPTLNDVGAADHGLVQPPTPAPIGGIRLGLWALFRALGRGIKRMFGRRGSGDL